jgi:hypothetical protein
MNGRDLYLRYETMPESMGKSILQNLEPGAILVVNSDDALSICRYLQVVRGYRTDVRSIILSYVQPGEAGEWYLKSLSRWWPDCPKPDFESVGGFAATYTNLALSQASIINGRRPGGPPIYFDTEPPSAILSSGRVLPEGFLWKWTEKEGAVPDPRAWSFPVTLEQVAERSGRKRGQHLDYRPDDVLVKSEGYEHRLLSCLVLARRNLAGLIQSGGGPGAFSQSAPIYESILKVTPEYAQDTEILYPLALDYFMLDRYAEANDLFERLLRENPDPSQKAGSFFYLGELRRLQRRDEEAKAYFRKALEAAPKDSRLRPELEKRLAPR